MTSQETREVEAGHSSEFPGNKERAVVMSTFKLLYNTRPSTTTITTTTHLWNQHSINRKQQDEQLLLPHHHPSLPSNSLHRRPSYHRPTWPQGQCGPKTECGRYGKEWEIFCEFDKEVEEEECMSSELLGGIGDLLRQCGKFPSRSPSPSPIPFSSTFMYISIGLGQNEGKAD